MNRKIVGYKAPMDLFVGKVKKGCLTQKSCNGYTFDAKGVMNEFPSEIVETWEPVYEEKFKAGDFVWDKEYGVNQIKEIASDRYVWAGEWSIGKSGFSYSCKGSIVGERIRLATPAEIEAASKPKLPKINGHEGRIEGDYVVYGSNCAKFHKSFFISADYNIAKTNSNNHSGNRTIKSIVLDSGVTITKDEISQIVKALEV